MPKAYASLTENLPVPLEVIERRIYLIRGQKVMLDSDLADLYQVETKALNRAGRLARPLRSQFGTSKIQFTLA